MRSPEVLPFIDFNRVDEPVSVPKGLGMLGHKVYASRIFRTFVVSLPFVLTLVIAAESGVDDLE